MESDLDIDITPIDISHFWDLTGIGTLWYWEYSGLIVNDCGPLDFSPYMSDTEQCPRYPLYIKHDSFRDFPSKEFPLKEAVCTKNALLPGGLDPIVHDIKELIVNNGPVLFRFQKDTCGYWSSFHQERPHDPTDVYSYCPSKSPSTPCINLPTHHHWVTIVGWNDNVDVIDPKYPSKSYNPIGYGAWLIKDSGDDRLPTFKGGPPDQKNPSGYWWFAYPQWNDRECNLVDDHYEDTGLGNEIEYM